MKLLNLLILTLSPLSLGQNLCDESYGLYCPEESGWGVGECLNKLEKEKLNNECVSFISLHEICKVDFFLSLLF